MTSLLLVVLGHDKKRITISSCERFEPLHRISSHQPSNVSIAGVVKVGGASQRIWRAQSSSRVRNMMSLKRRYDGGSIVYISASL